jgi:ABC-type glycerol-3-phosphate transport system substrate-binding protein
MLQNGVEMPMQQGDLAKFDQGVVATNGNVIQAGEQALDFYTKFAKITASDKTTNPLYTWNSRQPNSVDAFAGGTTAMMFNYSWENAEIKSKNPKLNYGIAPVPQIYPASPVTMANYWGYAVSLNKNTSIDPVTNVQTATPVSNDVRMHEAWQFLRFLTLKNSGTVTLYNAITKNSKDFAINFDPALDYLKKTNQPAARRDLIESQKSDAFLGPFATGNLIAKNWYKPNPDSINNIFANMIESVVNNSGGTLHDALLLATNQVNALSR